MDRLLERYPHMRENVKLDTLLADGIVEQDFSHPLVINYFLDLAKKIPPWQTYNMLCKMENKQKGKIFVRHPKLQSIYDKRQRASQKSALNHERKGKHKHMTRS